MNCKEYLYRRSIALKRLIKWPLLCGLLSLNLTPATFAAQDTYLNEAVITYPGTETFIPVIDATNFINTGTFLINFTTSFNSSIQPFYETLDTANYTNTGLMMVNTGFRFDNQLSIPGTNTSRTLSDNFFNQGTISCGSTNNTSDPYAGILSFFGYYPQCLVSATNIENPGEVVAGASGMIKLQGEYLDLSNGSLAIEGGGANAFGVGDFGLNTNAWNPSFSLGANFAQSSFIRALPGFLFLNNSRSYFDISGTVSNRIIRTVFIQDDSGSNVSYNVYFDTGGQAFGGGNVTIEWVGRYQEAATGNYFNNYLYLNNNYVYGASTNVFLINGVPSNFTLTQSPTPIATGVPPAAAGFLNLFPAGSISNMYSFANIQLASSSWSTNDILNHSITNLPGRIELLAGKELNLGNAHITGLNYLSVQSPNQFDGSSGALIESAYSDINIGVTNGFLTVSNLIASEIFNWGGTIQAWNTRWVAVDASGVTNDYRVLIVGSQLTPTTLAQVQDMVLHGTNSIIISDTFNIMRKFNADAQNLTLTTNGFGVGATSLAGELNVNVGNVVSWSSALPNLRNLTNNGAIRFQNLVKFMSSSNTVVVTPGINAQAAAGRLNELKGTNVLKNTKVVIGTNQYVFVSKLTNSVPNQVKIASKFDGTMSNLIAAINRTSGAGLTFSSSTVAHPLVKAGALTTSGAMTNHSFVVTAKESGTNGNQIFIATTSTNLTWNGLAKLAGGAAAVAATTNIVPAGSVPYHNYVNRGLVSDQGSTIWASNFESSGIISNGLGSFSLDAVTATLMNGSVVAGGDIIIKTGDLVTSNVLLQAGRSLTLSVIDQLTDSGPTNGNIWTVQAGNTTGGHGLIMTCKPEVGDLRGTTITNFVMGSNRRSVNVWAGQDRGASVSGYSTNVAVGRLILDSPGGGSFQFNSLAASSNALYVDYLELKNSATNFDAFGNLSALHFSSPASGYQTNLVIYYAQAVMNGVSVAEKLNHKNGDRLRWIPAYAGYFSSTNLVYPAGVTNTVNIALVQNSQIDSDGDGILNDDDATPIFVPAQVNFTVSLTNLPPLSLRVQWATIPNATNFIYYRTNLASGDWLPFTNFNRYYYGNGVSVTNAAHSNHFVSPQAYGSPATNVWVLDALTNTPHFYRVLVQPWLTYPY